MTLQDTSEFNYIAVISNYKFIWNMNNIMKWWKLYGETWQIFIMIMAYFYIYDRNMAHKHMLKMTTFKITCMQINLLLFQYFILSLKNKK